LDTETNNMKAVVRTGDKDVLVDAIRDYVNS